MAAVVLDLPTEFFDAIRSPLTKDRYEKRSDLFFRYIKVDGSRLSLQPEQLVHGVGACA